MRSNCLKIVLGLVAAVATPVTTADAVLEGRFEVAFSSAFSGDSVAGSWRIAEQGDSLYVELGDDFAAKKAPDLKLFLSPVVASQINGKNAVAGSLRIGLIDSHKGAQRYAIPKQTNLDTLKTLVLHCEEYSKLWGTAPLR